MNYEIIISFFTTVLLRIQVFWDVMLCGWVNGSTVSQKCSAMQQHGVKSQIHNTCEELKQNLHSFPQQIKDLSLTEADT
jgi:hypothetical protein